MTSMKYWYYVETDGTASAHPVDLETGKRIDDDPRGWFASPEGLILHGGVQACAFRLETVQYYDARVWIACGKLVPSETKTRIIPTAKPKENHIGSESPDDDFNYVGSRHHY
jgi:hypothetical protein